METIPTVEQFLKFNFVEDYLIHDDEEKPHAPLSQLLIDFAKLHVTEALRQASIKVQTRYSTTYPEGAEMNIIQYVDEQSILNSYSLNNIK